MILIVESFFDLILPQLTTDEHEHNKYECCKYTALEGMKTCHEGGHQAHVACFRLPHKYA